VCRDDSILPEATQRWLAERANANVYELPGDHSPFLARPDALVEILTQIVLRNAV
jgi:pimeloyl-ACP methyl ester carboxylesterase